MFAYSAEFNPPGAESTDDYVSPLGEIEDAIRHAKRALDTVLDKIEQGSNRHWFGAAISVEEVYNRLQSARRVLRATKEGNE